ncbi:MAG: head decoration protein [Porticoccaceae bacterium]|nr:head decoration protein [Porticoccaceae bacterium]
MTTLTENPHAGGFILSIANGNRSFENVTLRSGEDLQAGTVLGVDSNGDYAALDTGSSDGTESAAGILFAPSDASAGDLLVAAVVRDAEVNGHELVWPEGISDGDKNTAIGELAALGIVVR